MYRKSDESLVDTINRVRPNPPQGAVQFATLGKQVKRFYAKNSKRSYLQCSYSDSEDDNEDEYPYESESESEDEDEDDDEYEEGHWSNKFEQRKKNPTYTATIEANDEDDDSYKTYHRRCQENLEEKEYPAYVAYNDLEEEEEEEKSYRSYPAERADKGRYTRQARDAAMNNPIKKAQLDGVYMPPRRTTRFSDKPSETGPVLSKISVPTRQSSRINIDNVKEKENIPEIPVKEQIPIDARKPRFKDISDIVMEEAEPQAKTSEEPKKTIILQDYSNHNKLAEEKVPEQNSERTRTGPRQSDLSTQVNSKEVVEQILDTQVSLPLQKILGASRELSFTLQDVMRYKNPSNKPVQSQTSQRVYNTQVDKLEPVTEEFKRIKKRLQGREVSENRALIQVEFGCGNNETITALIDTGSQLNVARKEVVEEKICLPIDMAKNMEMYDVSGGVTDLVGMIKCVPLRCGSVRTEATEVYVGGNLPCELLLGRPWQRGNLVSIDERPEGTYLVFKNLKTSKPRYEIFVKPTDRLKDSFKPVRNVKVYTAMEIVDCDMLTSDEEDEIKVDNTTDPQNQITIFHEDDQLIATIDSGSIRNAVNSSTSIAKNLFLSQLYSANC